MSLDKISKEELMEIYKIEVNSTYQLHQTFLISHMDPQFDGSTEDWHGFYASYRKSADAYIYSDLENNFRLIEALKGPAKEAVDGLLIHPGNVNCLRLNLIMGIESINAVTLIDDGSTITMVNKSFATKLNNSGDQLPWYWNG
uniref:Uncharacterized protein n=1 Tax=Megaselia scalaris TaxID=36166 RepID=T1GKS3_MEGSC